MTGSEPPRIIPFYQPDKPLTQGSTYRSICTIQSGTPPITFKWTKDGHQLSHSRNGITIKSDESEAISSLIINDIKSESVGNYSCFVRNAFGSDSYSIRLEVFVPSKWMNEPKNTSARVGDNVVIECSADGSPKPRIIWRKISGNNKNKEMNGNVVKFANIQSSDSGSYECLVFDINNKIVLKKVISIKIAGKI